MNGEYLHFRCAWHTVDGHFEHRDGFAVKCEVIGCKNRGLAFWYRGDKYAALPQPSTNEGE